MKRIKFLILVSFIVSLSFSGCTDKNETTESTVTISTISGVSVPELGTKPVSTISETDEYTGIISWDGGWSWSSYFGGNKAYTATITLTAKSGYTLIGIPPNFFKVSGAIMTKNSGDSEIITAVFPATVSVYVGASACGGIVAYILQSGDIGYVAGEQRGLIAASADQDEGSGIIWANSAYQTTYVGTGTALGTGSSNTDKIISQNAAGSTYAAGLARACADGSYSDWFLPSLEELRILYTNSNSIGGFNADGYWSSSESYAQFASVKLFISDDNSDYIMGKDSNCRVRAVRAF